MRKLLSGSPGMMMGLFSPVVWRARNEVRSSCVFLLPG